MAVDDDTTTAADSSNSSDDDKAQMQPADAALLISDLLHDDGGYALDQGVCQDHRPYQRVAATMELVEPHHTATKDAVLAYLASTRRTCAQRLFDFRQPEHLEVTKYGSTVLFLRQLLGLSGFEVVPQQQGGRPPPPEMEAMMDWMVNDSSPFASHESGRAFTMTRDVVLLFKVGTAILITLRCCCILLLHRPTQIYCMHHSSLQPWRHGKRS